MGIVVRLVGHMRRSPNWNQAFGKPNLQAHWISKINGIIVAVAEEIVIAGVEQLPVFAHEPSQLRVIRSRSVFVEIKGCVGGRSIRGRVLSSSEQEPVVVNRV